MPSGEIVYVVVVTQGGVVDSVCAFAKRKDALNAVRALEQSWTAVGGSILERGDGWFQGSSDLEVVLHTVPIL